MTMDVVLQPCCMEHVERYGEIYAEAFSGEPGTMPGRWKMPRCMCGKSWKARKATGWNVWLAVRWWASSWGLPCCSTMGVRSK